MRRLYAISIVGFAMLALVAACGADPGDTPNGTGGTPVADGDGTFTGTVTIGPLCPVEPCNLPTGTPYAVRDLVLQQPGGVLIDIPLNDDGSFSTEIPAGTYTVHLSPCDYLGCATTFPRPGTAGTEPTTVTIVSGQTTTRDYDIDTGIRAPIGGAVESLAQRLRDAGAIVEIGPGTGQSFFSVPGQVLVVNGGDVQVYAYDSAELAAVEVAMVSPDGTTIGLTSVMWIEPPHFYSDGPFLALYVGSDASIKSALTDVMGDRFAGGSPITPPPPPPQLPEAAHQAASNALAERLGVEPDALTLWRLAETEFPNGALGCPQPGFSYTQALFPGFEFLYEHEGLLYQYNASADGRQLTDCVGEDAEAVPFRLTRGIVSVFDAFELADGPGPLAAEIVLRTAEEAAAYETAHAGAISIDTSAIDWSTQLLAGAVATGTGCTFVVEVTGTRADHPSATVDISARAEATGLCEKLGAEAVWVVLSDVPANYRVGFLLTSVGPPPCCKL